MLEFKDGKFIIIDETLVVPNWALDSKVSPEKALEDAGWKSTSNFGLVDAPFSVWVYRKLGYKQPGTRSYELLFSVELFGQPYQEIYCSDEIAGMECLIKLAPILSCALITGLFSELEQAAEYRDGVISKKWPADRIGAMAGLFAAMANLKGNTD